MLQEHSPASVSTVHGGRRANGWKELETHYTTVYRVQRYVDDKT
jgi:hypothetical protein